MSEEGPKSTTAPRKYKSGSEKRKAAAARAEERRAAAAGAAVVPGPVVPGPGPVVVPGPERAPPPTGDAGEERRYPSGAEKRRAAADRGEQARIANAAAEQLGQLPSIRDFDRLPPPPVGDPVEAIAWANDLVLLNLNQVVRHPGLEPQMRWRYVKELVAVLGLVRDKAHTQALVKKLRKQQQEPGDKGDLQSIAAGQFAEGWTPPAPDPGVASTPGSPPDEDQTGGGQPEPAAAAPEAGGGGTAPTR